MVVHARHTPSECPNTSPVSWQLLPLCALRNGSRIDPGFEQQLGCRWFIQTRSGRTASSMPTLCLPFVPARCPLMWRHP